MYLPADFEQTDATQIAALILAAPLATLVSHAGDALRADHIPLIMTNTKLIGHIAHANDLHRKLEDGAAVLAIFSGANAYITPNSYPSKADTHEVVPTWNYEVAHVHGTIMFLHDRKAKLGAVGLLTKMMETRTNGGDAWRMSDAPADYLNDKLDGIVGFEILITQVLAKSKLSQNKSDADRLGAAHTLGDHPIAGRMQNLHSK